MSTTKNKKLIAFSWYGGKFSHLDWILPLLPKTYHFVDVFGGSGSVILNRHPSPIDTYNDLNGDVVNFFRVLREDKERLIESLLLTPYSRKEYESSLNASKNDSPLELARKFFVKIRQGRNAVPSPHKKSWSFVRDNSCKGISRSVSRWHNAIEEVENVVNRLKNIQIENSDWRDILRLHDTPNTLFYLDPPYLPETRNKSSLKTYGNGEMSHDDHIELLESLKRISGKFAISGYASNLYDDKLSKYYRYEALPKKTSVANGKRTSRVEVLWINYNPNDGQMEFF